MSEQATTHARVVIVGSGFGGLAMAMELKRHGEHDFLVLERAAELGGVWRENTYPGAGCDVPSCYYSYSYAPNPEWPMRFSLQPDIHAYLRRVAAENGIGPHLRFGVEVSAASFDDASGQWRIETTTGQSFTADVFVPAMGQLSRPMLPDLAGIDSFTGTAFHSARWDHDVDLTGKRIAVIGTGASAIQFVPRIQPKATALTLFQRTAPYVLPKPDRAYRASHHRVFRRLPVTQLIERGLWWTAGEVSTLAILGNKRIARALTSAAAWQLRRQVSDPALRAALTPDYPIGCKRVLFADNYYPALIEPNVEVVTESIAEITPSGVRTADGRDHPVDVIIYGTGFTATDFLAPLRITGQGGRDLRTTWSGGARAYLGMAVPDFPNMFLMYGPNTNLGAGSIIYMLERQARYIRLLLRRIPAGTGTYLGVRADVEQHFDERTQRRLASSAWSSCASWYREGSGRVSANWPGLTSEYHRRTRQPDPADYRVGTSSASSTTRAHSDGSS